MWAQEFGLLGFGVWTVLDEFLVLAFQVLVLDRG